MSMDPTDTIPPRELIAQERARAWAKAIACEELDEDEEELVAEQEREISRAQWMREKL